MKSKPVVALFLALLSVQSLTYAGFSAQKVSANYYWYYLQYQKFETQIDIQGLFYETTITVRASLANRTESYWSNNSYHTRCARPNSGNYIWNWTFALPEECMITDLQIYDEDAGKFVSAQVMDLTTGEAQYEENSQNTPSVLLREHRSRTYSGDWDQYYQLKISPVGRDESKEFVLKYLSPCHMYWDVRRLFIKSRQFYTPSTDDCAATSTPAEFLLLDHNHPDSPPETVSNFPMSWIQNERYWYASDGPSNIHFADHSILRVKSENNDDHFLQIYQDGENAFYQMSVYPGIELENVQNRNIVILFDLISEGNTSNRSEIIESMYYPITKSTTSQDSLIFIINDFQPRRLDPNFQPRSESLIREHLQTVKSTIPLLNNLPFLLKEAINLLNEMDKSGEIWIISNDNDHGSPKQTAMDIIDQTLYQAQNEVKFYIIDACRYSNGNDYLYENLFRLTKGNYKTLRDYETYNWPDVGIDCFATTVSMVEVNPIPANGLSYSRISMNRDRVSFNNMTRYFQIGKFDGGIPFTLQFFGNLNQDLYSKTMILEDNTDEIDENQKKYPETYWYGNYIFNELFQQPQSYETIRYIETLSQQQRILTPYSAFVLPGLDGYTGFKNLTEKDTVSLASTVAQEMEEIPICYHMAAYPNPFNPVTTIFVQGPRQGLGNDARIEIYNCRGQKLKTVQLGNLRNQNEIRIQWDGTDGYGSTVASGTYLVVFRSDSWKQSLKILLSR